MSDKETRSRKWLVDAGPDIVAADDAAALLSEVHQVIALLSRVGGAVKIATDEGNLVIGAGRDRVDEPVPELFVTEYFVFEWHPGIPSMRRPQPDPEPLAHEEPEDVPEPEPVPVES